MLNCEKVILSRMSTEYELEFLRQILSALRNAGLQAVRALSLFLKEILYCRKCCQMVGFHSLLSQKQFLMKDRTLSFNDNAKFPSI
jgi:hypothetical protein